jgi:hypothetical protein
LRWWYVDVGVRGGRRRGVGGREGHGRRASAWRVGAGRVLRGLSPELGVVAVDLRVGRGRLEWHVAPLYGFAVFPTTFRRPTTTTT